MDNKDVGVGSNCGFLCDINDDKMSCKLYDALDNGILFVLAVNGEIVNKDYLLRKLDVIVKSVIDIYNVDVYNNYFDDGVMFTSSKSFIKKDC